MKLVQFEDGTFGVRRGMWPFGYQFRDMESGEFWWEAGSRYFPNCKVDRAVAEAFILGHNARHRVVPVAGDAP